MSHGPLDPSTDPLLSKLGQLGVPAGGAPSASAAALLSKAAVAAPVVAGLAGIKLYGLLAAALAVGLGGGVVLTELVRGDGPRSDAAPVLVERGSGSENTAGSEAAPIVESCNDLSGGVRVPCAPPRSEDDGLVCSDAEPAPPRVVYVTQYVEVPVAMGEASGGDDWIGEPEDEHTVESPRVPPSYERTEPAPIRDPVDNATASAEVVSTSGRIDGGMQPAEGHLRFGLGGGGVAFPENTLGTFSGALGLELLGPGPVRAAPLLAVNLDAGLMSARPLGTLAFDGEAGFALRPSPDLRISIAGVGGVRIVDQTYWDGYLEGLSDLTREEERMIWEQLPSDPVTAPTFGGRLGLVIGDRRRSPLSFRLSVSGQALVFYEPFRDTTVLLPLFGGTVGVDFLLPPAVK